MTLQEQLTGIRERIVALSERLSMALEDRLDPAPALALEGDEQAKARHLFVSQARKIEAELQRLTALAEGFRVHIY